MFHVDRKQNRMSPLEQRRFADLQVRERNHLQEWLVHQPDAFGEPLLIIQKEFDGFDETRERLDLLAIDKEGNLVIIENKLDDTGRDVTWQALKYTAYVSGLKKAGIVEIFQQYLDRYSPGGVASEAICDFLGVGSMDEAVVNPGSGQRMIFVAAHFRKEVTTTVLWLVNRGIRAQCFKVVPYVFENELFIDIQQIIPPPEAAAYMINLASKEVEEAASAETNRQRHQLRRDYWAVALEKLRAEGISTFANISPNEGNWLATGSGVSGFYYVLVFTQKEARVEFGLSRSRKADNDWMFMQLHALREEIEAAFGAPLRWRNNPERIQSQISFSQPFEGYNREVWPEMARWMADHIRCLEGALSSPLARLAPSMPAPRDNIG